MSAFRSLAMLMKPNELKSFSGDVDENKGERRGARNREKSEVARVTPYPLADAEVEEGLSALHKLAYPVANNVNERIHTLKLRNFPAVGIV
jgi:hypothetical protein